MVYPKYSHQVDCSPDMLCLSLSFLPFSGQLRWLPGIIMHTLLLVLLSASMLQTLSKQKASRFLTIMHVAVTELKLAVRLLQAHA